jgi:hypothetical protein
MSVSTPPMWGIVSSLGATILGSVGLHDIISGASSSSGEAYIGSNCSMCLLRVGPLGEYADVHRSSSQFLCYNCRYPPGILVSYRTKIQGVAGSSD